MSSLPNPTSPRAVDVAFTEDELVVRLTDGRTVSAPIVWFPRLERASGDQRADFELLGDGEGIHWSAVDEDISVAGLLEGRRSFEYADSAPVEAD